MKNFLKFTWRILCIGLALCFLLSSFSAYIPPLTFSYITFFAIGFPYLFIAMLGAVIINFFTAKKLAVFMLILLLPGFINLSNVIAFNFPHKLADVKNDSTLRVMTWNAEDFVSLWDTSQVRAEMLTLIKEKNPDVLCVQEFTSVDGGKWRVSVRRELDSLGFKHSFLSNDEITTNASDAKVTRGVAIFSRFPFTDSSRINIRHDNIDENLVYVTINFRNKPLNIYTAHLASFRLYVDTDNVKKDVYQITYERKRVIQYQLREVEQLHQKEAAIIHNTISKTNLPVIYCGDMNAVPSSYNYRLIKNNLQDAFLQKGFGMGSTFYKVLPLLRIDYCLADKRFKVINCAVITKKLSDHYPVVTDLQWK